MENASKALLIAAAILLVLILVSMGVYVIGKGRDSLDKANLDAQTVEAFNSKILQYCGDKKSASDMNSLMDAVASSNGAQNKISASQRHYIGVDASNTAIDGYLVGTKTIKVKNAGKDSAALDNYTYPRFSSGITFKAMATMDKDGFVKNITIGKSTN